jgi:uncharacterized membrane protein YjjP (DUF1212 family)
MPGPPESKRLSPAEFADYLLELGGALLAHGCTTYRVEQVIRVVAGMEGYQADAFGIPTGLFVALRGRGIDGQLVRMIRVDEWAVNLARLAAVDGIFNDVANRKTTIQQARTRLHDLERTTPSYPAPVQWLAIAAASGAAAVFFRGGMPEVVLSALAGALIGIIGWSLARVRSGRFLVDFLGAVFAGLYAWGCTHFRHDLSREVLVLSSVIALVPGMTLTTGLAELAQKNLVSGSSRLAEAFVTFLSILFGIALAVGAEKIAGSSVGAAPVRQGLPFAYQAAALVCASLAFAVLFQAPRRYAWAAILSGGIGYAATALGTRHLPGHVAAFAAALAISIYANGCARAMRRPAQLFQLPGMMLLVPGSFGFLSLEDFLRGELLGGAAKAFDMLLIGGAIVTGVLLANVVLPAKKLL